MKKLNKWKTVKELFSGWVVLFHLIFYFLVNLLFLSIMTKNIVLSSIVAIPAAILFFNVFSIIQKKIKQRKYILQEINKYATSLIFYLNSGKNVPDSLKNTLPLVSPELRKDIQKTLDLLSEKAILDTSHFQKYNLTSLDLIHQTLLVKYEKGGKAKEMFMKPFKGFQLEVGEIDDLIRGKNMVAMQIYMMQFFSIIIGCGLAFLPGDVYKNFLTLPIANFVVLIFYGLLLLNIFQLQKDKSDISLKF